MIHVICNGRWRVCRKGSPRALKVCADRQEAITYGNRLALQMLSQLTVHEKSGRVDFTLDYTEAKIT